MLVGLGWVKLLELNVEQKDFFSLVEYSSNRRQETNRKIRDMSPRIFLEFNKANCSPV